MQLFRLAKKNYANDVSGMGGLYYGGRWHRKGTQIIYTSEHSSLAILEILANSDRLPQNYCLIKFETPSDASIFELKEKQFPKNWKQIPYPDTLANFTEKWIQENKFWLMKVPSIHAPDEYNFLLNPLHSEHKNLKILSVEPYVFDERLKG